MIKAIIFDFFGVVVKEGYDIWLEKRVENLSEELQFFRDIGKKIDSGKITHEEFLNIISKKVGVESENIWPEVFKEMTLNENMLALIKSLKENYKIGVLSNATHVWLEDLLERHKLHEYFDEVYISSRQGFIKPQHEAFQKMLNMLDISKEEAIFIDDRQGNVDASNEFGIKAFCYTTVEKLKDDLKEYGVKV